VRLAQPGARIAVIANAIDDEPADVRRQKTDDECNALGRLGLQPREVDLRQHFGGRTYDAREILTEFDALWVRGGNVFVLRRALAESSCDTAIGDLRWYCLCFCVPASRCEHMFEAIRPRFEVHPTR
jgi:dipeptidase E